MTTSLTELLHSTLSRNPVKTRRFEEKRVIKEREKR